MRTPVGFRYPLQRTEKLAVVSAFTRVNTRKTRRIDTGCTTKGIDYQPGIIAQRGQTRVPGSVARLDQGIFD